jgi:hypothetical protein
VPHKVYKDLKEHPEHAWLIRRTIFWSILCAGIVALVIGRLIELDTLNQQANRSRKNCNLIQEDRRLQADTFALQADQVLGNPHRKPPIKVFVFKGTPFKKFQPLIVAQAKANRRRAKVYYSRIEDCKKVFPSYHFLEF